MIARVVQIWAKLELLTGGSAKASEQVAASVNNNDNSHNLITNTENIIVSMTMNDANASAALGQAIAKMATDMAFQSAGTMARRGEIDAEC